MRVRKLRQRKRETFAKIIDIYEERSELGERLETFQKQITDLRATLGHKVPANVADRISAVVNQTLAQDNETRKLLTASNEETSHELSKLEKTKHNTMLYSTTKKKGLALELDSLAGVRFRFVQSFEFWVLSTVPSCQKLGFSPRFSQGRK